MSTNQNQLDRESTVNNCKANLNFFGMFCLPEMFRFMFPPIFLAIWQMLTEAASKETGQIKLAIGLPRGFGKTILLKLFVVWTILFSKKQFILVVCNTEPLAEHFVADVCDVLDSLNFLSVFGDWKITREMDRQNLKKFSFRGRDIILGAIGSGGSPRGLNIKYRRPDLILMDDMQSREQAKSPTEAKALFEWMLSTLMKANNKQCCLFIFVGNKYPYEGTILKKLEVNDQWTSFVTGAILEDGESLWPELQPIESLLADLDHDIQMGQPEIFFSEVMNDDVAGSRSGLDFSKVNTISDDASYQLHANAGFILIDPSAAKKKSDDVAIGACLVYGKEPCLRELSVGKFNPGKTIEEAFRLAAKYGINAIVVEGVAYQSTLCYWIEQVKQRLGLVGMKVLEIHPNGEPKPSRIREFFKCLTSEKDKVWVHRDVRTDVLHQAIYYDPYKQNNKDDILDIGAYMNRVVSQYPYDILLPLENEQENVVSSEEHEIGMEF